MDTQDQNLNQLLLAAMTTYAKQACFQVKRGGRYHNISYRRFERLAFHLAGFFRHHDVSRVAIISDNSLEWMVAYVACLLSGGAVIPLRATLARETLNFILQDSGAHLALFRDLAHARAILPSLASRADGSLPDLKTVVVVGDEGEYPQGVTSIRSIMAESNPPTPENRTALLSHAESVAPQSPALIAYVTGQTGRPKGAVFDHSQGSAALRHIAQWFTFEQDDLAFTLGAWSEIPNLIATLHYFLSGVPNVLAGNADTVDEDMQQTSPTVMLATPHFFRRTYDRFMDEVTQMPESSQEVFQWAVARGREYRAAGSDASPELRQRYDRAAMTFFWRMRGSIGGRFRRLYSAGATLPQEVVGFFEAVGLPALNIYSLTEAGGYPAVSQPDARRPGSCGRIASGFEIRIADDGEVLVRGETVMRDYWRRPEETRQAFDADGWLRSGDTGRLDEDGYLYITGRRQQMMVLSTGHKIAPAAIEKTLTDLPFFAQAFVFGEGKPYVSALVTPDMDALAAHLQEEAGDDDETIVGTDQPRVQALLGQVLGELNSRLDRWEQIREYRLLEPPPNDEGLIPATIERHVIDERYAAQIDAMYPASVQLDETEITHVHIDPERLRELLEKESILDAWLADAGAGFLFDLAREKQIDAPSMVHISDAAVTIAQMEHEEKPLSTALIVGDPARIARVLPPSQIQLLNHDHIRRMRRILVTMAKMVDGLVLGYVVDKYGYVRGVHRLEVSLEEPTSLLLGPQFRHHSAISRHCDAVVFFVPSGGRQVRVFANGQLVGRYADGDWSPDNLSRVDEVIFGLAEQRGYDVELILRVLRCAFKMSEENLGAIFLLGDADVILDRSDASEISSFATFVNTDVDRLSDRELINFAKQDGATMVDVRGRFRGCMVLLRPRADTPAEIGPGKGARHSSAAKMSAEAGCLAITVSQDGPVTVYDGGRHILSL